MRSSSPLGTINTPRRAPACSMSVRKIFSISLSRIISPEISSESFSAVARLSSSAAGAAIVPVEVVIGFSCPGGRARSEQSKIDGGRYGVSARLHGELDEDAFGVGLYGLGGNLQLLSDAFVGNSIVQRVQDPVFATAQRLRDARDTSRQCACMLLSTVRENASDVGSELRG